MNKSPQYNQQTKPKQCKSEVEEISIYQNLESGCHSIIWKWIVGSMLERIPSNNTYLKVVTFSYASFTTKHIYVYRHEA